MSFCNNCLTAAFPALEKLFPITGRATGTNLKHLQRIKVGNLVSSITSRDDCLFCRFLVDCLSLHTPDSSYRIYGNVDGVEWNPSRYDIYLIYDREPWYQKAGLDATLPSCAYGWLRFGPEPNQPLICVSFKPQAVISSGRIRLPRQVYPTQRPALEAFNGSFDVQVVKSWLSKCNRHHSKCKNWRHTDLKRLLVIDIERGMLTRHSPGSRFVALSYVWGRGAEAQLAYIKSWMKPDRFSNCHAGEDQNLPPSMPQTIQDAIVVTKSLGERFLWVDLVCINQSDEAQKQAEVEQMDMVFTSAWLTLVCMDGPDADYGLTGASRVMSQTAQPKVNFPQGRLMATYVHSHWDHNGVSAWDSRAWCLQESLLSRRCLIFANKYVAMRCQEEVFHDLIDINIGDSTERVYHGDTYFREDGSSVDVSSFDWTFDNYGNFVSVFSGRQITDQGDMYNACRGALRQMSAKTGVQFIFGIPDRDISTALLWIPHHAHVLRRRHQFPSWTWLGWSGRIEYAYWTHNLYVECPHQRPNARRTKAIERSFLDSHRQSAHIAPYHSNSGGKEAVAICVNSTVCRIKVRLLRRAGTIDRPFPNKPPEEAQGDHWAILAHDGATLLNEIGEHQVFDTSTISFRLGNAETKDLEARGGEVYAVFIHYWPYVWDAKRVLTHFVSALLLISEGEINGRVLYRRLASVIVPAGEWLKFDLQADQDVLLV